MLQGLREGNSVLSELQREMSLEEVEKLMADTADAISYQNVNKKARPNTGPRGEIISDHGWI